MSLNAERREILLVEYQKAQDSAEHHDNLVSSVTSLWVGSAVLMGFVLNTLASKHPAREMVVLLMLIVLGMTLTGLIWWWVERAVDIKQQKYDRCKVIEQILGMTQHARVRPGISAKQWVYRGLMLLFLATWAVLLAHVARL